ncbi:RING finger protein 207 [Trichomycterus rosablanca]|uniref:RING finger protein 207 n=1 Tax=Trichomycterus rosablanca TaxID=2290929 RepID=UPI002F355C56
MPQVPSLEGRPSSQRYTCTKVLLAEGGETPFTEHCRNYENKYQTLHTEIQTLKDQMQELHRDLTKHHSLINTDSMEEILERSVHIDEQIAAQYSAMQTLRTMFEEVSLMPSCPCELPLLFWRSGHLAIAVIEVPQIWEETFQKFTTEQEIYEAQLHDLLQLKQENSYLMTIARQIGPYILSIAKVKERLSPRFQKSRENEDERTETMLQIYVDSTVTTESQHSDESCLAMYNWKSSRNMNAVGLKPDEAPQSLSTTGKASNTTNQRHRFLKSCHSHPACQSKT